MLERLASKVNFRSTSSSIEAESFMYSVNLNIFKKKIKKSSYDFARLFLHLLIIVFFFISEICFQNWISNSCNGYWRPFFLPMHYAGIPMYKWQLGIWVWIPPLPPFLCYSIISEKIFGWKLMLSFTFFTCLLDGLTGFTKLQICPCSFLLFTFIPQKFWWRVE